MKYIMKLEELEGGSEHIICIYAAKAAYESCGDQGR